MTNYDYLIGCSIEGIASVLKKFGVTIDWLNAERILDEAKPCPFCGGEGILVIGYDGYYIECKSCAVSTPERATEEEALEVWNRRLDVVDESKPYYVPYDPIGDAF